MSAFIPLFWQPGNGMRSGEIRVVFFPVPIEAKKRRRLGRVEQPFFPSRRSTYLDFQFPRLKACTSSTTFIYLCLQEKERLVVVFEESKQFVLMVVLASRDRFFFYIAVSSSLSWSGLHTHAGEH